MKIVETVLAFLQRSTFDKDETFRGRETTQVTDQRLGVWRRTHTKVRVSSHDFCAPDDRNGEENI
jgi:hypothetical protein